MTQSYQDCRDHLTSKCDCENNTQCKYHPDYYLRQELEGKCHALWLYNGGETQEWNGDSCDCEWIQGNLNCRLNPF